MQQAAKVTDHYGALDGLRAYAAIGIVLMHVLANGQYAQNGFVFERLIPSFTNLVFLFMVISGFAMSCGYYDRLIGKQISLEQFYRKRYAKVWPFFALLCVVDVAVSPSVASLYELFANVTLCFGLLPDPNMTVIGVGWFLGVVFTFYLLFPFFCFLLANKRRAWFAFAVALLFNALCARYFFDSAHVLEHFRARTSIVYCAAFFLAGGLIFLYREPLQKWVCRFRWPVLLLCALGALAYYLVGSRVPVMLILFSLLVIYAMGAQHTGLLQNPFTRLVSGISMEVYLCHMVIYRVMEKLNLLHVFQSDIASYAFAAACTLGGAVVFAVAVRWLFAKAQALLGKNAKAAA